MRLRQKIKYAITYPDQTVRFLKNRLGEARFHLPHYQNAFLPTVIYLVINRSCNLKCRMCDVGTNRPGSSFYDKLAGTDSDMELSSLKGLIDAVAAFKPLISITSTEPLLYADILEAISYIKTRGLKVSLTTNGFLLPRFAAELVGLGLDQLILSLDGPEDIHDAIRGVKGSFQRSLEGIRRINTAKTEAGTRRPFIQVNCTLSNANHHCLNDLLQQTRMYPIDLYSFSHLNFVSDALARWHNESCAAIGKVRPHGLSAVDLDRIDIETLLQQIDSVRKNYPDRNVIFVPELYDSTEIKDYYFNHHKHLGASTCLVPWKHAQILADGTMTVLTRCFDVSLGNVFEKPFPEVWNGGAMQAFRHALKQHGHFPACLRCCGLF